jgi:hypothetical protein
VNGKLDVAQWLWGLGGVDIHAHNDQAFRYSCWNGELEVAQWLLSVNPCPTSCSDDLRSWSSVRDAWCVVIW